MNRKPVGLLASKTITGFLHFKTAEAPPALTLASYERTLKQRLAHVGESPPSDTKTCGLPKVP